MGFVVDESRGEITVFDPITFISKLGINDRELFSEICSKGRIESILEIYKFLRRRPAGGRKVQACSGFLDHYSKTLSMNARDRKKVQQELNSFSISRTSFLSADERPYLPGSSVKGALRTAYLNRLAGSNRIPTPKGKYASIDLEKELMAYSDISNDPFRMVKVSDFMPVGNVQTKISYAVNIKKGSNGAAKGPPQIFEIIIPGSIFLGTITVEEPLTRGIIKNPVILEDVLQSSRLFYAKEYSRETGELKYIGITARNSLFNEGTSPVRIGRHSGAESVTVEGHRNIKILGGRGREPSLKDHATTMWLSAQSPRPQNNNNLEPFGWAEFCEVAQPDEENLMKTESEWLAQRHIALQENENIAVWKETQEIVQTAFETVESPKPPEPVIWQKARLTYAANKGEINASHENKNAFTNDKSILSEELFARLKKGKPVEANVKVELIGGRNYTLLEILK